MVTHDGQFPQIGDDDGVRALLVGGVVQSVAVDRDRPVGGYWSALLPDVRPRRALLLGLGGGTVAQLLRRRFGEVSMVGVDSDVRVLGLARAALGLDLPNLEIREQDAFEFLAACRERFDYLCVDLFVGGHFERRVTTRPFLRQLKAAATPGAEIVLNLFHDRRLPTTLQRIGRVLTIRATQRIGRNVVVRAGVR